jgi:hypothetical protein
VEFGADGAVGADYECLVGGSEENLVMALVGICVV